MAAYDDLRNETTVISWLERINRRPKTEKSYLMGFEKYCSFTGMSPTELLQEAKREVKENVDPDIRAILNRRYAFRNHLQHKTALAPNSIQSAMNAVTSFYSTFSLTPPKLKGGSSPRVQDGNTGIITKESIHDILSISDPLERAVVLTGTSSGLGMSDIINLKIKQYKEGYDKENSICQLNLTRIKTGVKFTTFLSKESCAAIDSYLEYRSRPSAPKQHILSDDNYLFIPHRILKNYKPDDPKTEEARKFSEVAFTRMYARLAEKSKKINPAGFNWCRSHQMRKFFNNTLRLNGLQYGYCEHFLGHKPNAVESAYFQPNPAELKKQYLFYMPYLTIDKNMNVVDSDEYRLLMDEKDLWKREAETAKVERHELQNMKDGIMKALFTDFSKMPK